MISTAATIFAIAIVFRALALVLLPEPSLPYNALFAYLKGAELLRSGAGFGDPFFPVFIPRFYSFLLAAVASFWE